MGALSTFTDFFTHSTGPAILSGPDAINNDAQLRNYETFDMLSRARKSVSGGSAIKDVIFFDDPQTAATYSPGDAATITNPQNQTTISVNWRFVRVPITWTEAEILLNETAAGSKSQYHQYKRLKNFKWQQAYTALANKLERLMFATPSNADMEANSGKEPYSVRATITTDGLAPAGFTTVQGVNPTTQSKWRNQNATYTAASFLDPDVGLIAGFDQISQLVRFKAPMVTPDGSAFTASDLKNCVVLTNREGRRDYMKALRSANDFTRAGAQDPAYSSPVFDGIPVKAAEVIDDQSVFTAGSPGYYFVNGNFLKMVFHEQKWMQKSDAMVFPDKPDTTVCYIDTYLNVFNGSRQRHAILTAA